MFSFSINSDLIDTDAQHAALSRQGHGAAVVFEGWVRDHNEGRAVRGLDYEVLKPLAVREATKIMAEAAEKFGVTDIHAVHREGSLAVGDCAVWVGVAAPHRGEAFTACRYVIDEIKHRLPIWKKEHYLEGDSAWVNCQHHDHQAHKYHEADYYARQIRLPEIGEAGQNKLRTARVLVVGAGGLGSSALQALAAAGVGTIGIADYDRVQISNLHRQFLFGIGDIGKAKTEAAAARLKQLNPFVVLQTHTLKVTSANVPDLMADYDLILDCTDNFTAKYALNDAAVHLKKPLIQASLYRYEGHALLIDTAKGTGCLRCVWPEAPAAGLVGDCAEVGVIGTLPAMFGAIQAHEAIKYFLGLPTPLANSLMLFDTLSLAQKILCRERRSDCAHCGDHPSLICPKEDVMTDDSYEVTVAAHQTRKELLETYRWIDVREIFERLEQPLPEAESFPFRDFDISRFPAEKDEALLIICAHGVRSLMIAKQLRAAGWENVWSLADGIDSLPAIPAARTG